MSVEIITKEDLQKFKIQLLDELKEFYSKLNKERFPKIWYRSNEVRKILNVSASNLQNLRVTDKLQASKIGGIYYYKIEDIQKLLNDGLNN